MLFVSGMLAMGDVQASMIIPTTSSFALTVSTSKPELRNTGPRPAWGASRLAISDPVARNSPSEIAEERSRFCSTSRCNADNGLFISIFLVSSGADIPQSMSFFTEPCDYTS